MTRDDIYDHLAQVYLGKKNKIEETKKKKQFNAWLLINIGITVIIFASAIYGLTAFLAGRADSLQNQVIYALNKGPIRINYDLNYPYPPVKTFSLTIPDINAAKYSALQFSVRALEEGSPDILRIEIKNSKNETASVFVQKIGLSWKNFDIPFEEFKQITDWSDLSEVSFIFESWNAEKKKGIVLIDNVCFSS